MLVSEYEVLKTPLTSTHEPSSAPNAVSGQQFARTKQQALPELSRRLPLATLSFLRHESCGLPLKGFANNLLSRSENKSAVVTRCDSDTVWICTGFQGAPAPMEPTPKMGLGLGFRVLGWWGVIRVSPLP